MPMIAYYSSQSGNTHHFVQKLGIDAVRIPISPKEPMPEMDTPFVLICPTYAADDGSGAVPKQVIAFLNNEKTRHNLRGVIAGGNTNFGRFYGHAGVVIGNKCGVPLLYRFELRGTPKDVRIVKEGLEKLWKQHALEQRMIA